MKILSTFNKMNMIYSMQPVYKDFISCTLLTSSIEGKSALYEFQLIYFFPSTKQKDWESTDKQKTRNGKQNRKGLL